jgi:hypothetical protein
MQYHRYKLIEWAQAHPQGVEAGLYAGGECAYHGWFNSINGRGGNDELYDNYVLIDAMYLAACTVRYECERAQNTAAIARIRAQLASIGEQS